MRYVTLVNRSSKPLTGTWDGRQYTITPGKNSFPEAMAQKFKAQNPLMGSEDPKTLDRIYLCSIEDDGEDCTPIEQTASPTLLDLSKLPNLELIKTSAGGLYAHEKNSNIGLESTFVKP